MSTSDLRSFPSLPPCSVLCILALHRHRRHHDNDDERRWCEIIDRNQIMRTRANNLFTDGEAESRGARRGHQDQYCHHHCHRHHRCHRHCHRYHGDLCILRNVIGSQQVKCLCPSLWLWQRGWESCLEFWFSLENVIVPFSFSTIPSLSSCSSFATINQQEAGLFRARGIKLWQKTEEEATP